MKIDVVGGTYYERCFFPAVNQYYGSAGRAAAALSKLHDIHLHTFATDAALSDLESLSDRYRLTIHRHKADESISFEYDHGLSQPRINPAISTIRRHRQFTVKAENILCFGMLEGVARVHGTSVVYDPQSEASPTSFRRSGNTAKRLAIVLNAEEAKALGQSDDVKVAARAVMAAEKARAIFVKLGSDGVLVGEGDKWSNKPAYFCKSVIPIGSGDIFSAAIAEFWAIRHFGALAAAELASKYASIYVSHRVLPLPDFEEVRAAKFTPIREAKGTVYLAGPFFDLQQRRLIEEIFDLLESAKIRVISPIHHIGRGHPKHVAKKDLAALRSSDRVFAVVNDYDSGTLFEIGYARAKRIPVFAYVRDDIDPNLTMLSGSGCKLFCDVATAVYRAKWNR